jgi:hypothetical protein
MLLAHSFEITLPDQTGSRKEHSWEKRVLFACSPCVTETTNTAPPSSTKTETAGLGCLKLFGARRAAPQDETVVVALGSGNSLVLVSR